MTESNTQLMDGGTIEPEVEYHADSLEWVRLRRGFLIGLMRDRYAVEARAVEAEAAA